MKRKTGYVTIINKEGKTIFQGLVQDLPLKEEYILSKSLELFREKEPCIIYRTHIMKKFYLELYDCLSGIEGDVKLSPELEGYFDKVELNMKDSNIAFER